MATDYPVLRWQVGDARITRVVESEGPTPGSFLFADATPEKLLQHAWLQPHFMTREGMLLSSIHAFVVESRGRVLVVDTCVGNDKLREVRNWNLRKGRFLEDMAEAGFPRERVSHVVCTHLHVDHVGWNTRLEVDDGCRPSQCPLSLRPQGVGYWSEQTDGADKDPGRLRPPVPTPACDVESDHAITPEVRLEPTHGHTPGHVSVHISSKGEEAVITGDLMHHPVQCALPSMASRFDVDPEAARQTRRAFLEKYKDGKALVLGTHFAAPTGGRIVRDAGGFRFAVS